MLVRTLAQGRRRPTTSRAIEAEIAQATRRWEDDLKIALVEALGEERATAVMRALRARPSRSPTATRSSPRAGGARHRGHGEARRRASRFAVSLYRPGGGRRAHAAPARLPRSARRCRCPASLPILENMGLEVLDEVSYEIGRAGARAGLHPRLRPAQRARDRRRRGDQGDHRGGAPARRAGRDRERRLQPPHARARRSRPTTSWCCAPTPST